MDEETWLRPGDLVPHMRFLRGRRHDRKLRLFSVACCRRFDITEPQLFDALDQTERFADGELSLEAFERCRGEVRRMDVRMTRVFGYTPDTETIRRVRDACEPDVEDGLYDNWQAFLRPAALHGPPLLAAGPEVPHGLLMDIFGNPFRPIEFAPGWRTAATLGLARTMYDSRVFDRMPILVDALEEAGCEVPEVLAHCRDPDAAHVRGCWVVDGVLGKS